MDEQWKTWFMSEKIEPLRITYEDLAAAPHEKVAKILKTLGMSYKPSVDETLPVAKLADATNKDWAKRFLAEKHQIKGF